MPHVAGLFRPPFTDGRGALEGAIAMRTKLFGLIAMTTSLGVLGACKDDPPPPPPPTADTASTSAPQAKGKPTRPSARDRTTVPRISAESMKQYRVETCYFGSMGLKVARDAYMASVGKTGPSATNLPDFGEYPENKPREENKPDGKPDAEGKAKPERKVGRRRPLGGGRALPFIRHVRACSIAKSLKQPAYPELDAAVGEFEDYANDLQRLFLDATRYYAREQYKKDDFKRGKSIHEKLMEKLPMLDDKLAAFTKAMEAWWPEMKPGDEKLDEAGKVSLAAVNQARDAVRALMGSERDDAALDEAIEGLEAKLETLKADLDEDRTAPHPRVMVPKLEEMVEALKAAKAVDGPLDAMQSYAVTAGMAGLIEAHQRGVAQLLRRSGGGGARMPIRPRLRGDAVRALPRPAVTGKPLTPKGEPK